MRFLHNYFLVLLMLISIFSFGQEEKTKDEKQETKKPKHEVRIIMENFMGRTDVYTNNQVWYSSNFSNPGTYEYYNNRFKYGLGYNLNFNKIGIRTKVFYNSYNETYFDRTKQENNSNAQMLRGSVGVNYRKNFEKVTLFFGVDVSYFKIDLEQIQYSTNLASYPDIHQFTNYNGIGIEPLIGLNYFFSKHFSFSSEIRFIRDVYKGNTLITYENYSGFNTPDYEIDFEGNYSNLGPKGSISLNVHF
ncbi:MAG: hypothetical protein JKX68_10505 [Flavobacteriales bacterium]|nr:hypothetical protein [Flavobacteriales bacterium]